MNLHIHKNKTIIFQIRTLYTKTKNILPKLEKIIKKETQKLIKKKIKNKNNLLLSVMSDWNPAEIIGKNSYPLSIFVYNFLVLKFNWYLQRYQNGYSKLENKKLYYQIGNTLYIDVIQSFLSFIPRNLDKKIRTKLLNFYINKLYINPKLHDKIESEIVVSNYSQKFLDKIKSTELKNYEIDLLRNQLLKSNKIIKEHVNEHFSSLGELNKESINIQKKNTKYNNFKKIFEILKITQKKFILPFAHLARGSFVSKIILKISFLRNKQTI